MAYLLDRKHKPSRLVSKVYNLRGESTKYVHVSCQKSVMGPLASAASRWHKRPRGKGEEAMPDFAIERGCAGVVCGIDEAGRGPLAGPVVAAAVVIDRRRFRGELRRALDDSKVLSRDVRESCYAALSACARPAAVRIGGRAARPR